jgi:transcriptional regulator with XRE-family HTH domain
MTTRLSADAEGRRRSRLIRQRIGAELEAARLAKGLSLREVARRLGVSPQRIGRAERGSDALTIDLVARIAPVVGLQLAAQLHSSGDAVRDRAHLALLTRFGARVGAGVRIRTEVPMPIQGDLRSGDAVIAFKGGQALVEAETHLGDLQLIERKATAKQRDLAVDRLVLLVADTRHNREVIDLHPELCAKFPVDTRTCLRSLARGDDPGGNALVIL